MVILRIPPDGGRRGARRARARAARAGDARVAADQRALRSVAAFHLAMLLLARGDSEEADGLAWRFGYAARLSDAVFARRAAPGGAADVARRAADGVGAFAFDGALPDALFRALRRELGPGSRFWSGTYATAPGFFSYNFPCPRATRGTSSAASSRAFWRSRRRSCPRARRLHGVLPAAAPPTTGCRTTFMVGFWGPGVATTPYAPSRPTPNMAGAFDEPWCVARCAAGDDGDDRPPVPVALAAVAPGWARVAGDPAAFGDLARGARPWVGRYFLRNGPADIDDEVRAGLALAGD
ncbi:hypothetical protein JL722_3122 [Aureococcus anophagefferens]|nr:hypothetical protein JL722_3122 [Aureococcus anophagefferens]